MLNIDLVKSDALGRLRPYMKQAPSWCQRNAKAKRDEAIRAYLAQIAPAQLTAESVYGDNMVAAHRKRIIGRTRKQSAGDRDVADVVRHQRSSTRMVNERSSVRPPVVGMRLVTVYDCPAIPPESQALAVVLAFASAGRARDLFDGTVSETAAPLTAMAAVYVPLIP
jgi:hypothetical protein